MRRFFIALFLISIVATGGAYYWRTYLPEATTITLNKSQSREIAPGEQEAAPSARSRSFEELKEPSQRQDLAMTISILSSVISALAAVVQTWMAARSYRQ